MGQHITGSRDPATFSGLGFGTMIMTMDGELPVEWLTPGDRLITRDHGAQPLRALVRQRDITPEGMPLAEPVVLYPHDGDAATLPWDKLRLAPGHRVLVKCHALQLHFGLDEALACPGDLTRRRVAQPEQPAGQLIYHHLILARHELIMAGGLWVESTCADIADRLGTALPRDAAAPLTEGNRQLARPTLTRKEVAVLRHAMPHDLSLRDLLAA